jgi:hypothetical protein
VKRTREEEDLHKAPGAGISQTEAETLRLSMVDAERRDAAEYRGDTFDDWDRAWYYLIAHRDNRVVKAAQVLFLELEKIRNAKAADSSRDARTKERTNG